MAFDDSDFDGGIKPGGRKGGKPPAVPPPREVPTAEECPVKPLGKTAGLFAFMTPGGEIEYVRAKDLATRAVLTGLFDGDVRWLRACFPDQKEYFGAHWAAAWLMQACVAQGFFQSERMVRGPGAWRLQRGKALLLHHGDTIEIRSEHGSPSVFDAGTRHGGYIYVASRPEAKPADEAATRDDVAGFLNFLDGWRYSHAEDPRVLLGWIGCAYLAGALKWRPHIWLTGDTGTGKSTLEQVIRNLVGSSALRSSEPTKMAIAQALAGAARPVLLDEFERDINPVTQDAVVQLARLASTEDQAGIMRGSPEGRVRTYVIRGCFYFSGIVPAPLKPQDRTRIHVIDLRNLDAGGDVAAVMATAATMAELGPRLRARAIEGFWRFQENERVFEAAILKVWKKGGRVVDQMGTLLAMSEMLLRDRAIGFEEACALLGQFAEVRDDILGRPDEGEAQNCLRHLVTSRIRCEHVEKTVGEIVRNVKEASGGESRLLPSTGDHRFLMRHGMRVMRISGEAQGLGLAVARSHRGLSELFETTHWAGGAWNAVLKRVAGSYAPEQPVRFAGEIERCRVFPLALLPIDIGTPNPDGTDDCVEGPPQPQEA